VDVDKKIGHAVDKKIGHAVAIITGRGSARRRRDIVGAALSLARTNISDADARLRLDQETRPAQPAARRALKLLSTSREEFDHDRAYRLLEASLNNGPVQPIKHTHSELFSREKTLGGVCGF
jgi:hypothetical protein